MVFLLFSCQAKSESVRLNTEFEEYRWAKPEAVKGYDLNLETIKTFTHLGLLSQPPETGEHIHL
jgi:hypothetical protein